MTTSPQSEPRSRTLLRHTRQAVRDQRLCVMKFATALADRYLAEVLPEDRVVKFRPMHGDTEQVLAAQKHNVQIVDRYLKGVVKAFPADLEDAWVSELPQPYRTRCTRDLAARRGLLAVTDPRSTDAPLQQSAELSDLLREVGEACTRLAPIFADGRVDETDMPFIGPALDELGEVLTVGLQLHRRLAKVLTEARAPARVGPTVLGGRAEIPQVASGRGALESVPVIAQRAMRGQA